MGITKQYFLGNIIVPCTLKSYECRPDGLVAPVERQAVFELRRETQAEADEHTKAAMLGQQPVRELRLARFCRLLAAPPTNFDDFPQDDRPLAARAAEYFGDPGMDQMVYSVLLVYDKVAYPAELFRGF